MKEPLAEKRQRSRRQCDEEWDEPAQIDRDTVLERLGSDRMNVDAARAALSRDEELIADDVRVCPDEDFLATQRACSDLAVQDIGR